MFTPVQSQNLEITRRDNHRNPESARSGVPGNLMTAKLQLDGESSTLFQKNSQLAGPQTMFVPPRRLDDPPGTPDRVLVAVFSDPQARKVVQKLDWMDYISAEVTLLHKKKAFCGHKKVKYYLDTIMGKPIQILGDDRPEIESLGLNMQPGWYFLKAIDKERKLLIVECQDSKTLDGICWDVSLWFARDKLDQFEGMMSSQGRDPRWSKPRFTGSFLSSAFKASKSTWFYETLSHFTSIKRQQQLASAPFSLGAAPQVYHQGPEGLVRDNHVKQLNPGNCIPDHRRLG